MPRTRVVEVNGKSITIKEKRIGELEELFSKVMEPIMGTAEAKTVDELKGQLTGALYDKLPLFLDVELTSEDIKNAYPSEIEALIKAFIDVNFFGLKKAIGPMLTLAKAGLAQKQ